MKNREALYEGMYILSPTLSEEARAKAVDRLTLSITQAQGSIEKVLDMGRKKLAYEVRGSKEGYYYLIYFKAPSSLIKDLWKEYLLNEDLLRFMTLAATEVREDLEFKTLEV